MKTSPWLTWLYFMIFVSNSTSSGTDTGPQDLLRAYDCSNPRNIQDSSFNILDECNRATPMNNFRNVSYQLLQRESSRRTTGYSCTIIEDRTVRYCGVYDHQTAFPAWSYTNKPVAISIGSCREHIAQQSIIIDGISQPLTLNGITLLNWDELGSTYIKDGEAKCEGETWHYRNMKLDNAIVTKQWKFQIQKEEFVIDDATQVTAYISQVKLPCHAKEGGCRTPTVTYLWDTPKDDCSLAVARTFKGMELKNDEGSTVVMSTDGTLVRFVKKSPISICGRIVYSTNYATLFLYPLPGTKAFSRRIHPSELSISTYVNNRDDYLYNFIIDKVEEEFRKVLYEDCKSKRQQTQLYHFIQHSNPGLTTWFLGNGTFATAAGEVLYTYVCKPVWVRAIGLPTCFQALPVEIVQISQEDQAAVIEAQDSQKTQLFMEPLTHKITTRGVSVPCTDKFLPKYQNAHGQWIMAAPAIHRTSIPKDPITSKQVDFQLHTDIDWSQGGIYTKEELAQMENYLEFSRTRDAISFQLANQADHSYGYQGSLRPQQLFPDAPAFRSWSSIFLKKLLSFLHAWGETASIFISIWMIWKLLFTLLGWFYNFMVLHNLHGCSRQLLWIPCTTFLLMRRFQNERMGSYAKRAQENDTMTADVSGSNPTGSDSQAMMAVGSTSQTAGGCDVSGLPPGSTPMDRPPVYPTF